ncbi:MAG: FG-GAP-like repeat-containing protein [Verrucomicrobiota bacterium]
MFKPLTVFLLLTCAFSQAQQDVEVLLQTKCGSCHATPDPGVLPRDTWPHIMKVMAEMMADKGQTLSAEDAERLTQHYVNNAPQQLDIIPDDFSDPGFNFQPKKIGEFLEHDRPQITSLKFSDLDGDGQKDDLLVTDNLNNSISWLRSENGQIRESLIASAKAPVNTTAFDIDGDGDTDYGVSIMGQMHPNDLMIGEFRLLINQGDGRFEKRTLLSGVPRITDCAPGDFDGDGDLDLVIAMFGWRETGRIELLEQVTPGKFESNQIYNINGCMRVVTGHFNDDDQLDFLALITQQHEVIARFIGDGQGNFDSQIINRAGHPTYGSSSISLHDLDQDGDQDILYTNGDMMDEHPFPKPYHGVRWLENDNFTYTVRPIANMPGCYDAKPHDMDGDGDLDLVISALYFGWHVDDFPSLAWVENLGGFEKFQPRRIAYAPSNLANIAIGDLDNDGLVDIIGGGMHVPGPIDRRGRLTLWEKLEPRTATNTNR